MTEGFPKPGRRDGLEPCGECHIKPDETCDICGARHSPSDAKSVKPLADEIEREMMAWRGENGGIYAIRASAFAIAQKVSAMLQVAPALENGPAVLADAHTNPPLSDLSSLRKGAEVAPLDWHRVTYGWLAFEEWYRIEDNGPNWPTERYWLYERGERLGKFDTLADAQAAMQTRHETRIRSALVSGSREEQADA